VNTHSQFLRGNSRTAALALGTCAVALLAFGALARNIHPSPGMNSPRSVGDAFFPVEISPDPVELGVVNEGRVSKAVLSLTNRAARELVIDRLETGCPCLTITPGQLLIAPSETKVVAVEFDPSGDPDFHGRLCIDISGYSKGKRAFHTVAEVEVRNDPASRTFRLPESATIGERQP
jgi:Protein of unknown function (DUF1573)